MLAPPSQLGLALAGRASPWPRRRPMPASDPRRAAGHAATMEPGPAGGPGVEGFEEGIEAAEHGGGLPQLDAHTFPSQIFWLIVSFLALYWLLSRKALPRVGDILEARQERIAADLDRAAALRNEAEEALRKHQAVVAEAQARAAAQLKADPGPARRRGGQAAGRARRRAATPSWPRPRAGSAPPRTRRWPRSRAWRPRSRRRRCSG